MSEVIVFDVAHGNCCLIRSQNAHAVIDAPCKALLLNTLEDMRITCVDVAFISHADKDHIAGVIGLLTSESIELKKLYLNPDSQKDTRIWRQLRAALKVAERQGKCEVILSLTTVMPGIVSVGEVDVRVEAPSNSFAAGGSGSTDERGRRITSNSISAVLRVTTGEHPGLLLAGDIDEVGLDDALENGRDLTARTLVFPHHGGLPASSDATSFVETIMRAVTPSLVIFSNGRGKHDNPRPEIVGPVARTGCGIACTQMAHACNQSVIFKREHLEPHRAQGQEHGASCAGSMTIDLSGDGRRLASKHSAHQKFIDDAVETPMCRPAPPETDGPDVSQ
ncbi:MBL fold metallo-hydrolase [Porphyrobacter algicida]|uniref:MBL fold metallo-hydrolase n=1 Tax=Qipengyuania algicida TaxID=1836209 RepID=A0A845AFD3_9SPHN|nr:MBL fold metallo-hydrolase [Qipengyuania algicida]MXP27671.1 MBL fold metallo-hydrolase [Qipengyuania algicida]